MTHAATIAASEATFGVGVKPVAAYCTCLNPGGKHACDAASIALCMLSKTWASPQPHAATSKQLTTSSGLSCWHSSKPKIAAYAARGLHLLPTAR